MYKKIIYILCFTFIIFYLFKDIDHNEEIEYGDIALLFVMYNIETRNEMTNDVIDFYIKDGFPREKMFLVDSANNGVSSDKIPIENQCLFDQTKVLKKTKSTTTYELYSINRAMEKLNFGNATHIIKLTTKYKIKNLYKILNKIPMDNDLIVQYRGRKGFKNTEILGYKILKFNLIYNQIITDDGILEKRIYKLINKFKYHRLKKLRLIPPLYKRSNNSILKYL